MKIVGYLHPWNIDNKTKIKTPKGVNRPYEDARRNSQTPKRKTPSPTHTHPCHVAVCEKVHRGGLSTTRRMVECVGPWFLNFWQVQPGTTEGACDKPAEVESEEEEEEELGETRFDEDNVEFLRSLDPKDWREQDHYAVIGLSKLRHRATEDDIKKAYRLKVLRHHPDKRKGLGEEIRDDDDYFTCITRAYEILGTPRLRRAFDSVDPHFDDDIPTTSECNKSNFYELFGRAFENNARWSEKKPVPKLGTPTSSREHVEKFYAFWYNFESWREYSYLDEEEKEKGQAREERRYIEKLNKASRGKLKKVEMARVRSLVDLAYSLDPRIARFRQEEKDRKEAIKQAKKDAARARIEEIERKAAEAEAATKRAKEEAEAEEKAKQEILKAEQNSHKRVLKSTRTALRKLVKANEYYATDNPSLSVQHMSDLEKICESFNVDELSVLVQSLHNNGKEAFIEATLEAERRIEKERRELMEKVTMTKQSPLEKVKVGTVPWTPEQQQLLIKAVNLFPAGTIQRWDVVANFINQHNPGVERTSKEVLNKAKDLQSGDHSKNVLKVAVNKNAYDNFEKVQKGGLAVNATTSERFDSVAEQQGVSLPWTAAEQQLLEQALKTYPASTAERWDKIASCLPSRTKKDCMKRYKELADMVKAKKAAQAAVANKPK